MTATTTRSVNSRQHTVIDRMVGGMAVTGKQIILCPNCCSIQKKGEKEMNKINQVKEILSKNISIAVSVLDYSKGKVKPAKDTFCGKIVSSDVDKLSKEIVNALYHQEQEQVVCLKADSCDCPNEEMIKCPFCNKHFFLQAVISQPEMVVCSECKGVGHWLLASMGTAKVCPKCNGTGKVPVPSTPPSNMKKISYCSVCQRETSFEDGYCLEHPNKTGGVGKPLPPDEPSEHTKIVCLCGSTRFKNQFFDEAKRLTCEGYIVLAPFHFRKMGDALTPELEQLLTDLHLWKIDLADEVFILNVDNYIGESTNSEMSYSYTHNKPVRFLNPSKVLDFNWNHIETRVWKDTKGGID